MDRETYLFHQTPSEVARKLIPDVPLIEGDRVLEPFKGEGAFYDNLPPFVIKDWCELEEGRDYIDYEGEIDWVISNPPFQLDNGVKRINAFFQIIDYYSTRVKKGIAFLGNYNCLSSLTPKRMKLLNDRGLYLQGYTCCNIKKWRGRFFFMIFTKEKNDKIKYLEGSY